MAGLMYGNHNLPVAVLLSRENMHRDALLITPHFLFFRFRLSSYDIVAYKTTKTCFVVNIDK